MGRAIRVFVAACSLAAMASCSGGPTPPPAAAVAAPSFALGLAPPFFPVRQGAARYQRRDSRAVAELGPEGMTLALRGAETAVRWGLAGARAVEPRAEGPQEGRINFLVGPRSQWRTDLPAFSRLRYAGVYPGIDLVLESRPGGVEYTLEAAPGADLSPVRFRYRGASATLRADGSSLELRSAGASFREEGLVAYQVDGEQRRPVGARYARVRATADGVEYGIQLERRDPSARVVIDPVILWGSYVGAANADDVLAIATDSAHAVYLAGRTSSSSGFPLQSPIDSALGGTEDAFVMKVGALGNTVTWATYLGGDGFDQAHGIALDPSDNVYVVGFTYSTDFPSVGGFDTTRNGTFDGFITKIAANGASLLWSSYLGGSNEDFAMDVASDAAGDAYVVGWTSSSDFPISGGFDSTRGANMDAFVTKIGAAGAITWSSFLGGTTGLGEDEAHSVAVDGSNNVYVGGATKCTDFPVPGGFQTTYGGGSQDGFVAKVNADGASLAWSTFVGGTSFENPVDGLAVDGSGNVYGLLSTQSADIPITGGFDSTVSGLDLYAFKIDAAGSSLAWSTYLGGSSNETAGDLAIDGANRVYVTGTSTSADFPVPGGFDTFFGGTQEAVVSAIEADGASLAWSSFLGENGTEVGAAVAFDGAGSLYVGGSTGSLGFPATGGFDSTFGGFGQYDGFIVKLVTDTTAPVAGTVNDGPGADVDYQSSLQTIQANWSGFSDPESGIFEYQWAIGTTAGGTNVLPFTSVGLSTSASRSALGLTSGLHYYVTVRAVSGAGRTQDVSSDGVVPDGTSPFGGTVNDGVGADADFQTSTTTIAANWSGFTDAESPIVDYAWAIGTSSGATDVQPFTSVGTATGASNTALTLLEGATYYATVRATNAAGRSTLRTSDGVKVDSTRPIAGTVNDGPGADIDVQGNTTTISASWSGFSDPESGIAAYSWAIGTTPGGTEVMPLTNVGTATGASQGSLSLVTGVTYYVTVSAQSGSGFITNVTSDGVLVDGSPPSAGTVLDGPMAGVDIDLQTALTTLSASWSGAGDPESGIAGYEWAIGTSSGAADVQGFTAVGLATSASNSGLTLASGTRYFVTVRATNGAGLTGTASSDGVLVDASPPVAGTVNDGQSADADFQAAAGAISANWSGFSDAETGIAQYEWAIGTTPGGTDVQGFSSAGTSTSAVQSGLSLSSGTPYYVTVRATNGAGLVVTASSDGVTVDTTAPAAGAVADGAAADIDFQSSTTTIQAGWSGFSDAQSGVARYEWAIGTAPGDSSVQGFTDVGAATSATASSVTLTTGTTYFVTVRATNAAGLTSTASSDGVKVDASAPVAGTVNDGSGSDIDTQSSTTALSASWSGFSDPDSGLVGYEWAVGTSPGATDVQGFTGVGTATSASTSSVALTAGATYFVTVRATNAVGLTSMASSDGVRVSTGTSPTPPTASPASIDFGSVAVGEASSARQVTVQNGSAVYWTVTSIATDDPEFAFDVTGFPNPLPPNQSATLSVSFNPAAAGARTGVLRISFSGAPAPAEVSLSGTGVAEPEPPGGCGCTSVAGTPLAGALLALATAVRRRRRR